MKNWPYQLEDFETELTLNGISSVKRLDLNKLAEAVIKLSEYVYVLERKNEELEKELEELEKELEEHKKDIFVHSGTSLFGR